MEWTKRDVEQITCHGLSVIRVNEQLTVLNGTPQVANLRRPCILGDGILRLSDKQDELLLGHWAKAADANRIGHFIPASGAATRLFASAIFAKESGLKTLVDLTERVEDGESALQPALVALSRIHEMALWDVLCETSPNLASELEAGRIDTALDVLLDTLCFASLPKGLVPFHRSSTGLRTPVAEHLEEARSMSLPGATSAIQVHFTVGTGKQEAFEAAVAHHVQSWPNEDVARLEVSYSRQSPGTDCVALNEVGEVFRTENGALLFRPGGHGALLHNLNTLGGDVVVIKNIDSVVPDRLRGAVVHWRKRLVGLALEVEAKAQYFLERWEKHREWEEAFEWMAAQFGECLEKPEDLPGRLNRPIRVCGMVANAGQPGGGPFWLGGEGGESIQIVEGAQLNKESAEQVAIWNQSAFFNPVDMVCIVRDRRGAPIALEDHVDSEAWIVTHKRYGTQTLKALENPGLWNGGMADWNAVFVEIPASTFNPVKTWADLLKPQHQG